MSGIISGIHSIKHIMYMSYKSKKVHVIVMSNLTMHLSDTPFIIQQPKQRPRLLERLYKLIRTPHWCGVLPLRALEIGCK